MVKNLHNRVSALPKCLWLMLLTLLPAQLSAFEYEHEEQTLNYSIIDENAKTVRVSQQYTDIAGDVIIPSEVSDGTDTYSVTAIEDWAFFEKKNLTSVNIPNSVTTIGGSAFSNCESLTSVTIPNSVTTIGEGTFWSCESLTSVNIPNSVTTIGGEAFWFCASLTSINIPNSVTTIGGRAFSNCGSLTSVTIPNSVTTIGEKAFSNCNNLTSVTFQSPSEELLLGSGIFDDTKVTSITFDGDYTIKRGVFDPIVSSDYIKGLMFMGNCTIGESAFEGLDLQFLYFFGTSYIGKRAFFNSNAAMIYLKDCQGIEEEAFATPYYIYTGFRLWCFNEEPPYVADSNAFSGIPNLDIFVPINSVGKYQKAYGWDYFSNFTGMGEIKNLTFTPNEVHLDLRKSTTIKAYADFTGGYEITKSQWISSDEEVVGINQSGTIQAKASGMAMIYFSFTDNYHLSSSVNATLVTVGDVDFSLDAVAEKGTIAAGESTGVKLTYGGQGYTVESEKWATSDAEIATVDENGVITGVAPGEATITLTVNFDNGLYVTRKISVTVGDVDFSLDAVAEKSTIVVGESTGVKLTYGGQGYTVESEKWATSDAEIATVDENGVITGVAPGEAIITLTVNFDNGLYATREISITVIEESGIDDVNVSGAPAEYYNLNGVRVNGEALTPGLYIKRQGGKSAKVLVK